MKGPDCDDEIAEARRTHAATFRLAADHHYQIPGTPHGRRLVVFERLDAPGRRRVAEPRPRPDFAGPVSEVTSAVEPDLQAWPARPAQRPGDPQARPGLLAGPRPIAEVLGASRTGSRRG